MDMLPDMAVTAQDYLIYMGGGRVAVITDRCFHKSRGPTDEEECRHWRNGR